MSFFSDSFDGFSASDVSYFDSFQFPTTADVVASVTPESLSGGFSEMVKSFTNPLLDVAKTLTAIKSASMSGALEKAQLDASLQIAKSQIGANVAIAEAKTGVEVAKANAELARAQSGGVMAYAQDNSTMLLLAAAGVALAALTYLKKG